MVQIFFSEKLDELVALYKKAEANIKFAEEIDHRLAIPSVNELRYAGNHLVRALKANTMDAQAEELARAAKHCQRAGYDAVEVVIINFLEKIAQFKDDYRQVPLSTVLPDYVDICGKAAEANRVIQSAREQESDRDRYYEICLSELDSLRTTNR